MEKEIYKKGFVFGAVAILLTIALFMPMSIGKNVENIDRHLSIMGGVQPYDTTAKKYTLSLNPLHSSKETDNYGLYDVTLTEDESKKFENELGKIDVQISKEKDFKKFEDLARQKLEILRNYSLLPKEFTIENFSDLTRQIGEGMRIFNSENSNEYPESGGIRIGTPFVGMGPSVFSYITLFGTVTPYGFSPNGLEAVPVWPVNQTDITLNSTGIFWNGTGPMMAKGEIEIHNRMWEYLFPSDSDIHTNFTEMHGIGMYYGHIILGHTVVLGLAFPDVIGRMTGGSLLKPIIGSFYYLGMLTLPFSFTLYKTWPRPWTTIIDFGIVPSVAASIILPFWFPEKIETTL